MTTLSYLSKSCASIGDAEKLNTKQLAVANEYCSEIAGAIDTLLLPPISLLILVDYTHLTQCRVCKVMTFRGRGDSCKRYDCTNWDLCEKCCIPCKCKGCSDCTSLICTKCENTGSWCICFGCRYRCTSCGFNCDERCQKTIPMCTSCGVKVCDNCVKYCKQCRRMICPHCEKEHPHRCWGPYEDDDDDESP